MSSDKRTESEEDQDKAVKINLPQILAATGASTTAAIVASVMGINGTVAGVALFSVVSSVATVLYLHSMNKTKERIAKVVKRGSVTHIVVSRRTTATLRPAAPPASASGEDTDPRATAEHTDLEVAGLPPATASGTAAVTTATDVTDKPRRVAGLNWRTAAVSSVAVFALSIAVLSAIALMSGKPPAAYYGSGSDNQPTQQETVEDGEKNGTTPGEESSSPGTQSPSPSESTEDRPSSESPSEPLEPSTPQTPESPPPSSPTPEAPEEPPTE